MLPVLDHIAVAVKDLSKAQKVYSDLGFKFDSQTEIVTDQGVETAFAPIDENAQLELLCPYGEDGPIHRYIEKKGEGLHHICFKVEDIKATCDDLEGKGYRLLYPEAKVGAHNCLVNFIHPKSTGGVLIEVSQTQKSKK